MDFRVILQESARKKLSYLGSLTVPNRQGRLIALGEAAKRADQMNSPGWELFSLVT